MYMVDPKAGIYDKSALLRYFLHALSRLCPRQRRRRQQRLLNLYSAIKLSLVEVPPIHHLLLCQLHVVKNSKTSSTPTLRQTASIHFSQTFLATQATYVRRQQISSWRPRRASQLQHSIRASRAASQEQVQSCFTGL